MPEIAHRDGFKFFFLPSLGERERRSQIIVGAGKLSPEKRRADYLRSFLVSTKIGINNNGRFYIFKSGSEKKKSNHVSRFMGGLISFP